MRYYFVRTSIVTFTAILARVIPKFGYFINLAGAFAMTNIAFIMPSYMYLVAYKDEISRLSKIVHWMIIVIGIALGIMSIGISLVELVEAFTT